MSQSTLPTQVSTICVAGAPLMVNGVVVTTCVLGSIETLSLLYCLFAVQRPA